MFTGLIETTGTIVSVKQREGSRRIAIAAPGISLRTGDSIAVSGVCLTAVDLEPSLFHADLAAETVARTSLSLLAPGATVNLEMPTPAGAPLGGHVVQGHVDGTGTLLSLEPVDARADVVIADWWLRIAVPAQISRYMVEKGSIAVEGISLTIARWEPGTPEGDIVSVAIKFVEQRSSVEKRSAETAFDLSVEYLIANGY
jgi:riboflavin synthase